MAVCPSLDQAVVYLRDYHDKTTTPAVLEGFRRARPEQYETVRRQLAPRLEQELADGLLDNARLAAAATGLAIERSTQLLESGKCVDPSRVARDLADVQAKSIDKRLALEGRPSQVVETRNASEIIRALEGMKVVKSVDVSPAQIEEAHE